MIVKNIKFINNKVEIVLENKSFFLSKENYIENPLSIDSFVSDEKIESLMEQENVIQSKIEMIKMLNRKSHTEQEIIKKLKEKELKENQIKEIIENLKRIGLVNDEYAGVLIVENLLLKRKGKLEIKKTLKEKGINFKVIDKLIDEIEEDVYLNNFQKVYEKYLKIYNSKASKVKEQMILNKLREYGYEEELIKNIIVEKNDEIELDLARQNLRKIMKIKKLDLSNYENINKIKTKLAMKGFNYDIINLVLEEVMRDETY